MCRREAEDRFLTVVPFSYVTLKLLWHAFLLHALPTPGAAKVRNSSVSNDGGDSSGSDDSDHDEPIEVGEDEDDDVAGNDAVAGDAVPAASCAIRARIRASPSALRGGKCGAGAGVDRPSFAAPYANTQPTPNTKAPGSARLKVRLQRAALARSLLMGDLEAAIAHHTGSEWTFTVVP